MPKIAVSLYVLLFLLSICSVIAASFPGSAAVASSIMEPSLAACDLGATNTLGQQGSGTPDNGGLGQPVDTWHTWLRTWAQDVYSCSLLLGASHN